MYNIIDTLRLPFRKERELFSSLYGILGFYPHNIEYYHTALTHRSASVKGYKGKPINNERLEFLGDAILDAIVADIVYRHFPNRREGFLTNTRSKIVQRESLGKLAVEMGLDKLIISISRNRSHNSYMAGNAFEALIGAVYLDRGYGYCMKFVKKRILDKIINIDKVALKDENYKSRILEWCQKGKVDIEFRLNDEGQDSQGSPFFTYSVLLEGVECGKAGGYSKRESQQKAAKMAYSKLKSDVKFMDHIFVLRDERTKKDE